MADPKYRVLVYSATGSTFAVGSLGCEVTNPKNIGYARYLNDVGEAFFTVLQDQPEARTLRGLMRTGHVFILRDNEVVWRGILSEHEANGTDVVFYAYGYESVLFKLCSAWNQTWADKDIDDIITDIWTRAKTDLTYSQVGFVTTGTIQAPVTTSGGSTPITLPVYKAYYKRILFEMKELAAISTSDTTNVCYFEIAYPSTLSDKSATFNFWKNKSTDRSIVWEYGVNIKDFEEAYAPLLGRNDILGVGSGARNQLYRVRDEQASGSAGYETVGRAQEPVYLSWVRDEADLTRVIALRAARALRSDTNISLYMQNGSTLPINAANSGYYLGDRVTVRIDRGATQVDKLLLVVGQQVIAARGREVVIPMVQEKGGV